MSVTPEMFELTRSEFERLVGADFAFLIEEFAFPAPLFWEFADTLYVSFENERLRTVTWCSKRDDSVWTWVERLSIGRGIGLDTVNSLQDSELDYPPDTGGYWTRNELEGRLALEASILRAHLPVLLGQDESLFHEYGGATKADSIALDDPIGTFPRQCTERFRFLEREYGLAHELDQMGSGVLYRGDPLSVRIVLLETSYEHESEPEPTLSAEIVNSPQRKVPPPFIDAIELEISDRTGSFTPSYLERSFDEVEKGVRSRLPLSGVSNE
jgi:hypothetical protein